MEQAIEALIVQNMESSKETTLLLEAIALENRDTKNELKDIKKAITDYKPEKIEFPKYPDFPELPETDLTETNKLLGEIKEDLSKPQKVNITLNLV